MGTKTKMLIITFQDIKSNIYKTNTAYTEITEAYINGPHRRQYLYNKTFSTFLFAPSQ